MDLRAFLNDDGTAVFSIGRPGDMTSAEVAWHTAEFTLKDEAGTLVRRISVEVGGKPEVTGPNAAVVEPEHASAESAP